MPSHFSTLGFAVRSEDDFIALAREAADSATPPECSDGRYLRWACGSGAGCGSRSIATASSSA